MMVRHIPRPMLSLASLGWASLALIPAAWAQPAQGAPPPRMYEQESDPPMFKVRGLASTAGWQDPALVPLVRNVPSNGMLDLVLVAEPPPDRRKQ